jgi:hypothetical protein
MIAWYGAQIKMTGDETIKDWMPKTLEGRIAMFSNVRSKIREYAAVLRLTPEKVSEIERLCLTFADVFDLRRKHGMSIWSTALFGLSFPFTWKKRVCFASRIYFRELDRMPESIGLIPRFREIREEIVNSPGYSVDIGEDLMVGDHA